MMNDSKSTIILLVFLLIFVLFIALDMLFNLKKKNRNRQFIMPFVAILYSTVLFLFFERIGDALASLFRLLPGAIQKAEIAVASNLIGKVFGSVAQPLTQAINTMLEINPVYLTLVLFNVCALVAFLILKLIFLAFIKKVKSPENELVSFFYEYHDEEELWFIKPFFRQARTFLKVAFLAAAGISASVMFESFYLYNLSNIRVPFYPVFAVLMLGEFAFFLDGNAYGEHGSLNVETDRSRHITNYVALREKLSDVFGDKLSSDGTTVNDDLARSFSIDQMLSDIEKEFGHDGENYASYIRKKAKEGISFSSDYIQSGIELVKGKSLLFNTPFYYKLSPYIFYAMNSALLKGGKVLIVLGRHGTSEDVIQWCEDGLFGVTNIPDIWNIAILDKKPKQFDIGVVTRSGVHDLELHKANRAFLNEVAFVVIVEPSRLITTAQIGLNLLVRNISVENDAVFCSIDRNCDGLVDALSHTLMTNITEVSATEYPQGISSYMCWLADGDYLQHRLTPGISRYLGMGTEISVVALQNQVEKVTWYGGDAFPVIDQHWIAKQYYHDLLSLTSYPVTQETFDNALKVSYNLCNEKSKENSFIVVEDESNNLFEIKRELSTITKNQGFINVISTEYMLHEYMAQNEKIFNADSKAIPFISADYARTNRNICLKICLQMSILGMTKSDLMKELLLVRADTTEENLIDTVWTEICRMFLGKNRGTTICGQTVKGMKEFRSDTISLKREFSTDSGQFEDIFVITDKDFLQTVLNGLQNAKYITEKGNESICLGTELKGHILQKYLPGQFFTLDGKYYEMLYITADNQVMVRRASDHINGRPVYRQIRKYRMDSSRDDSKMGMLKTVNGIHIYHQFADFEVDTPAYWRMNVYNNFKTASKILINGIPRRQYLNKQILKIDFSDFGEAFTDKIRVTLTLLINEVFQTLFAENQSYIVAVTAGDYEKPLSYSLCGDAVSDRCIYIIEDSQLDIGLLVAVERNLERIMNIIADYLLWNKTFTNSNRQKKCCVQEEEISDSSEEKLEKRGFWQKIKDFFSKIFSSFKRKKAEPEPEPSEKETEKPFTQNPEEEGTEKILSTDFDLKSKADFKETTENESNPSEKSDEKESNQDENYGEEELLDESTDGSEKEI